jgi:GntR family transcriptional regulator
MQLYVNPSGEIPIFRQIVRQITEGIAGGRLKPNEKLLSHRELAEQLVIAPMTVKRAYDELEALGFIATQRGRGTFVCEAPPELDRTGQREEIKATARALLSRAYLGGLRLADVVKLMKEADREVVQGHVSKEDS